jgi:predicted enzyme related to lactoylglutathione lyase
MKRVTGIGGIFFKAQDPKSLKQWYREHLGIDAGEYGATFNWRADENPDDTGQTLWSPFPHDTKYFDPSEVPFMINYRVADLDGLLVALRAEGVTVEDRVENYDYGRFAWISDPEGNRIELWEPTSVTHDSPDDTN